MPLLPQIGDLPFGTQLFQDGDGLSFGFSHADTTVAYTLGQAGVAVGGGCSIRPCAARTSSL